MTTDKRTAERSFREHTATLAGARNRLLREMDRADEVDDVVESLRRYAAAEKSVPEPVRGIHGSQAVAEKLVEILSDAGVEFADPEEAPSQVAAAIYAGWLAVFRSSSEAPVDPVDWLFVLHLAAEGIDHAIRHPSGAPELARQLIEDKGEA